MEAFPQAIGYIILRIAKSYYSQLHGDAGAGFLLSQKKIRNLVLNNAKPFLYPSWVSPLPPTTTTPLTLVTYSFNIQTIRIIRLRTYNGCSHILLTRVTFFFITQRGCDLNCRGSQLQVYRIF